MENEMKKIVLLSIASSLLLTGSCEKKQPVADYEIQRIKGPLSPEDIEAALDVLGMKIERFNYYLPVKTQVTFFGQEYIKGVAQSISHNSSLFLDSGLQKFMLFAYRENDSVKFSIQAGGGRVGCGSLNIKDFGASTQGLMNQKELKSGPEIPLYLFAANKNGIESFSPDDTIEKLVKKYELAFVIYADIQ
jgi:hypothetical protein